jgi:uncharacterized membrane protein
MDYKDFENLTTIGIFSAIAVSTWSGIVAYLKRDLREETVSHRIFIFFKDIFISSGFSILTYMLLVGFGVSELVAVAIGGFVGHLGIRSSYLVEILIAEKLGSSKIKESAEKSYNREGIKK